MVEHRLDELSASCWSYMTPKKIGRGLLNIRFPSVVFLGCHAASRLKNVVSHIDELSVNFALVNQAPSLSSSGCKDVMIMSLLRALSAIAKSSA